MVTDYDGVFLLQSEVKVLQELETLVGVLIPPIKGADWEHYENYLPFK